MKLKISLSGYTDVGGEDNLVSLKNPVPNGDYTYFGMNPITHSPGARRLNEDLDSPSTIKRRPKTKEAEATVDLEKSAIDDGLGQPANTDGKNVLPDGADMYYGLKPLEHNPISKLSLSADFGSRFGLNDPVWFKLYNNQIPAQVLAVTFVAGKVMYTLALYTGFADTKEYADQYGLINSIGWDENGKEYVRINNVDSTLVEPREIPTKITIQLN